MLASTLVSAQGSLSALTGNARPEPLPLAQAFPFYLSAVDDNHWQVTWNPASGHYLYRHAFAFSIQRDANSEPVSLTVDIPEGLQKTDQFFGDIEAYYGAVTIDIEPASDLPGSAQLWIEYQGCADWGFCYPPQRSALPLFP